MTKEEELRQLEELKRIQAEERRKMQMQDLSYIEDSAFAPDNSYMNDSAFTDSAFMDSAFTDSAFASNNSVQRPVHNTQQTYIQNPMNPVQHSSVQNPMYGSQQYVQPQHIRQPQHVQQPQKTRQPVDMQQPQRMRQQQSIHQPQQTRQPQDMQQPQRMRQPQGMQQSQHTARQSQHTRKMQENMQPQNGSKQKNMRHDMQQENMQQNNIPKNGKKKKKKHPVLKIVIVLLLIFAILFGTGMFLVVRALNKMERVETVVSKRSDNFHGDVYNILLIGQDAREGEGMQRADTIILCTINKKTHTVTLTSIMRDMYVNIPGYGGNRVNAAFAFGGIDLLDQTIEENLGIKIDGNALVDFGGFMEAMTAVGNLDIELTAEEAAYLNEHPELGTTDEVAVETWNLHEGVNNMTPGQVLGYSRIRHVGNSDWDRTNRQRFVINAVIDKIKHGHLLKGFKVLDGVCPHIMTDMTTKNMLKAGFAYIRCSKGGMNSFYLPAEGTYQATYVDGMAVLLPDIEANKQVLQQYMQGIDPAAQ